MLAACRWRQFFQMDAEAAYTGYDVVTEAEEPCPHWAGWILGEKFTLPNDEEKFAARLRSCLWFTYRKNFKQIGSTGYTSDSGWGCTMRCGQMLLAEALSRVHLPAGWVWKEGVTDSNYNDMLRQFVDMPENLYSIQQIAQSGVDYGRNVGNWFGPNTMCQVIKTLSGYDSWSRLAVHVAMDLIVIEEEVRNAAMAEPKFLGSNSVPGHVRPRSDGSPDSQAANKGASSASSSQPQAASVAASSPGAESCFRPTLLLIPLRLGLDSFEARYTQPLLTCFSLPQSVGFIGGKPRHALWFVGHRDNRLVYLDPHTTQSVLPATSREIPDATYHNSGAGRMRVVELDPSVAVGFFCKTEEELTDLFSRLRKDVCSITPAMFEVHEKRHSGLDLLSMDSLDDDFSLTADDATQEESTCIDDPPKSTSSVCRSPQSPEYDDYDIVDTDEVSHTAAMELVGPGQDEPSEVANIARVQHNEILSLLG